MTSTIGLEQLILDFSEKPKYEKNYKRMKSNTEQLNNLPDDIDFKSLYQDVIELYVENSANESYEAYNDEFPEYKNELDPKRTLFLLQLIATFNESDRRKFMLRYTLQQNKSIGASIKLWFAQFGCDSRFNEKARKTKYVQDYKNNIEHITLDDDDIDEYEIMGMKWSKAHDLGVKPKAFHDVMNSKATYKNRKSLYYDDDYNQQRYYGLDNNSKAAFYVLDSYGEKHKIAIQNSTLKRFLTIDFDSMSLEKSKELLHFFKKQTGIVPLYEVYNRDFKRIHNKKPFEVVDTETGEFLGYNEPKLGGIQVMIPIGQAGRNEAYIYEGYPETWKLLKRLETVVYNKYQADPALRNDIIKNYLNYDLFDVTKNELLMKDGYRKGVYWPQRKGNKNVEENYYKTQENDCGYYDIFELIDLLKLDDKEKEQVLQGHTIKEYKSLETFEEFGQLDPIQKRYGQLQMDFDRYNTMSFGKADTNSEWTPQKNDQGRNWTLKVYSGSMKNSELREAIDHPQAFLESHRFIFLNCEDQDLLPAEEAARTLLGTLRSNIAAGKTSDDDSTYGGNRIVDNDEVVRYVDYDKQEMDKEFFNKGEGIEFLNSISRLDNLEWEHATFKGPKESTLLLSFVCKTIDMFGYLDFLNNLESIFNMEYFKAVREKYKEFTDKSITGDVFFKTVRQALITHNIRLYNQQKAERKAAREKALKKKAEKAAQKREQDKLERKLAREKKKRHLESLNAKKLSKKKDAETYKQLLKQIAKEEKQRAKWADAPLLGALDAMTDLYLAIINADKGKKGESSKIADTNFKILTDFAHIVRETKFQLKVGKTVKEVKEELKKKGLKESSYNVVRFESAYRETEKVITAIRRQALNRKCQYKKLSDIKNLDEILNNCVSNRRLLLLVKDILQSFMTFKEINDIPWVKINIRNIRTNTSYLMMSILTSLKPYKKIDEEKLSQFLPLLEDVYYSEMGLELNRLSLQEFDRFINQTEVSLE